MKHHWYSDFLAFITEQRIFSKLLTPPGIHQLNPNTCWDPLPETALSNEELWLAPRALVIPGQVSNPGGNLNKQK